MGYGFAVPANLVSKIVEDILAYGTVQRGWLGIQVSGVNSEIARQEHLAVNEGALVNGFGDFEEKSAAKAAGLIKGDVIVKLDDTPIKSNTALIEYIGMMRPGDKVVVTVNRDGKEKTFNVTLRNRDGNISAVKREEKSAVDKLGINLEDVDAAVLNRLDLKNGVKVKSLLNGKIRRYTDMEEGFIITRVDDVSIKSAKEVNEILKKKKPGDLITFSGVYSDYSREYIYALRM
jgi:S1-C subfamily serine protease